MLSILGVGRLSARLLVRSLSFPICFSKVPSGYWSTSSERDQWHCTDQWKAVLRMRKLSEDFSCRYSSLCMCWESYIWVCSGVASCWLEWGRLFWIVKCMKVIGAGPVSQKVAILIGVLVTPIFMLTIEIPGDWALIRSTRQQRYIENGRWRVIDVWDTDSINSDGYPYISCLALIGLTNLLFKMTFRRC